MTTGDFAALNQQKYHFVKYVIEHIQDNYTLDDIELKNPVIDQLRYNDVDNSAIRKFNINRLKPNHTIPDYGNDLPKHHPVILAKTHLPIEHDVWETYEDILCVYYEVEIYGFILVKSGQESGKRILFYNSVEFDPETLKDYGNKENMKECQRNTLKQIYYPPQKRLYKNKITIKKTINRESVTISEF